MLVLEKTHSTASWGNFPVSKAFTLLSKPADPLPEAQEGLTSDALLLLELEQV